MGIRNEREKFYKYKEVYNLLTFSYGKNVFRIQGKIYDKEDIEVISRIFYKKLEEFLYSKEFLSRIYEDTIKKVLEMNNLLNKSLFDILKERKFHFEAVNILIIRIYDYVYYTIRRNMPYTKKLRVISKAMTELLENTYKFTDGEFCITVGLKKSKLPLLIKIENKYDKNDIKAKKNLIRLQEGIDEVNYFDDPNESFLNITKKRIEIENENKNESRLGFAKIRMYTGGNINLSMLSNVYGEDGVTLTLYIPIELFSEKEIMSKFENLYNKKIVKNTHF
jgi:hypothetical protein